MVEDRDEYKLYVRVTKDQYERFTRWAKRLGLTYSQFGNMCIQAGMGALIRAVAPEEAFSPAQLLSIIREAQKQGVQMDFSNFLLKEKEDDKGKGE